MSPLPGTRTHVHEEAFSASPERVFSILHTPSAIRKWWGATRAIVIPREGGLWAAIWGEEDEPDSITTATMSVFDPPRRIVFSNYSYAAKGAPLPFAAEFETEFTIRVAKDKSTILRVAQSGFPLDTGADEFYAACDRGWRDTFAGIRKYLGDGDE
jgi:uncharacterized protein YndB with AHSA1/START domain